MDHQFLRTQMLLGEDAMAALHRSHVAVFGLGGVGSYAVEALARSGVGELTLIDDDAVSPTNLNRQLEALHSTIGQRKTDAVAARCRDINPGILLHPICARYDAEHREMFFSARYDYIIDAIDTVSSKLDLIQTALARDIPILSALGTGNKTDPSQLRIDDISKTFNCSLARVMRKELRARGITHLRVVFSPELPASPEALEAPPPGRRSVPASLAWVPGCAGLMMAGEVVLTLSAREKGGAGA
ncbi:MAG: tRNA threonylcarbamoyladenosine dehydratase [Oscillospiraceae bacterium]|nr:tRNA threonylcarbamoyladenosine dehydratase [Oscillospiraceae bacterium]